MPSRNPPKALRQPREGMVEDFRTTLRSDPAVMASHESYSSIYAPIRSEKVVSPGFPEIYKLQR